MQNVGFCFSLYQKTPYYEGILKEESMLPEEEQNLESVRLHLSEDALELYALSLLSGSDLDDLDDHLLVCPDCRLHLDEVERTVSALRHGLRDLELRERAAEMQKKKNAGRSSCSHGQSDASHTDVVC